MKTDLSDVNETRKTLRVEIPSDVVNVEVERVARQYSRKARVPGFRPGKVPARVVKQRFRDQILHDVAHDLIPQAVGEALQERGVEPLDTPDIRDVSVEEGQPLIFTASFDTVPTFDPGDYSTLVLQRRSESVGEEAVDKALQRLRERAARYDPIEGRGIADGDSVTLDIDRREEGGAIASHQDVTVEMGAAANPPGFDSQLIGLDVGGTKQFTVTYPADYGIAELANTLVDYTVTVKALKQRVLPDLDDEFAKGLGDFESLEALRTRVRQDLEHEARHAAEREVRAGLMAQVAGRLPFEAPASLVERELDRRIEEFARRLAEQNIDPRLSGVDWNAFRGSQGDAAREAVAGAIVLDEVARRERLDVSEDEIEREITRYAERTGRTPAAVRAALKKDGGLGRIHSGLRREKSIDFLMGRATLAAE